MLKYIKDYPRPQFVREEWTNLNDEWNFCFDDENVGEINRYYDKFPQHQKILVPYTYETKLSKINDESIHNVIWYNKKIHFSKINTNKKVLLHFEGSDYITKVWINGIYLGDNVGAYSRFSFEISNYLTTGDNEITVRVEDSLSTSQVRGKQRYKEESFKCWYVQTTGIWKTVWLEVVNVDHLNHIKNIQDYDNKKIILEVETNIDYKSYEENNYYLETLIYYDNELITTSKDVLTQNSQKLEINICDKELKLWSPQSPNLYDIEYKLYKNNNLIDHVYSYFGIRKISIQGNKIFLNDKELFQRLILDQGYWQESGLTPPNEEALIKDINYIMKFGYNGLRKHQKIEDERFLYWCDVKGLLVWSEMPNCYDYNDTSLEYFINQWIKVVKQNYNHPSIITWVPINESWGVKEVKKDLNQQSFINSLYYITKSLDSSRPVITNDGWCHTISDIITIHDYKQDYNELKKIYIDNLQQVLNNKIQYNNHHDLFVENYKYEGQPIIISEYGGISLAKDKGWGYGKEAFNEEEFLERFTTLTNTIKKIPNISGYCYTQLTDVYQEVNGLLNSDRKEKFSNNINKEIKSINNKA